MGCPGAASAPTFSWATARMADARDCQRHLLRPARRHREAVQDRDGAVPSLKTSRRRFPFVERAFADSAYAAERVADATCVATEIVRKPAGQIGFAVHPRRWVLSGALLGSTETAALQKISRLP